MQLIKTQFAQSATADFEENTWTFLMNDRYEIRSGQFAIVDKPVYDSMINALKSIRAYFGENDKTAEQHFHYDLVDKAIKLSEG